MGFNDKRVSGPSTRYLTPGYRILGTSNTPSGVFVEVAKPGDPNATPRVNKVGNTVFEHIYNCSLTGKIINSSIEESKVENMGDVIKCMLIDENFERWQIEFPVRSSYGRSYFQKMCSINTGLEVTIEPYAFIPKDKNTVASGLQIYQFNGEKLDKVPNWFSQENPNGVPEAVPTVYKGRPSWDDTDKVNHLMYVHNQWANHNFAEEKQRVQEMRAQYAQQRQVPAQAAVYPRTPQQSYPQQGQQRQPQAPQPSYPQHPYPQAPQQSYPNQRHGSGQPPQPQQSYPNQRQGSGQPPYQNPSYGQNTRPQGVSVPSQPIPGPSVPSAPFPATTNKPSYPQPSPMQQRQPQAPQSSPMQQQTEQANTDNGWIGPGEDDLPF